jgi:futalosine hydrolase
MQILLVAATAFEIAPFLSAKPAADFLVTGLGTAEAVYHITKRLQQIDYDLVIQAGIAGSFTASLPLGEVVMVKEDNFADLGISEKDHFYTVFEKGFSEPGRFPFSNGWLVNNDRVLNRFSFNKVRAVTVNTVSDNEDQRLQLISKFDPQVETMEGAALHYTCLQEGVPFLQLRTISNYVGERDKTRWKMEEAIEHLNEALVMIYAELTG